MVCHKADLTTASGCALANIPLVIITKDQFDSIENGKEIVVDTDLENSL